MNKPARSSEQVSDIARLRHLADMLVCVLLLSSIAAAQDSPLAEAARAARERKAKNPGAAVVTNEDIPSVEEHPRKPLSEDKALFLEYLRRKKDPAANLAAVILAIDMGDAYEKASLDYFMQAKRVCADNEGRIPPSKPDNPELAQRWEALNEALRKFHTEIDRKLNATTKDLGKAAFELERKKFAELDRAIPRWREPGYVKSNPEMQRLYQEISARYDGAIRQARREDAQRDLVGNRIIADEVRLTMPCGPAAM